MITTDKVLSELFSAGGHIVREEDQKYAEQFVEYEIMLEREREQIKSLEDFYTFWKKKMPIELGVNQHCLRLLLYSYHKKILLQDIDSIELSRRISCKKQFFHKPYPFTQQEILDNDIVLLHLYEKCVETMNDMGYSILHYYKALSNIPYDNFEKKYADILIQIKLDVITNLFSRRFDARSLNQTTIHTLLKKVFYNYQIKTLLCPESSGSDLALKCELTSIRAFSGNEQQSYYDRVLYDAYGYQTPIEYPMDPSNIIQDEADCLFLQLDNYGLAMNYEPEISKFSLLFDLEKCNYGIIVLDQPAMKDNTIKTFIMNEAKKKRLKDVVWFTYRYKGQSKENFYSFLVLTKVPQNESVKIIKFNYAMPTTLPLLYKEEFKEKGKLFSKMMSHPTQESTDFKIWSYNEHPGPGEIKRNMPQIIRVPHNKIFEYDGIINPSFYSVQYDLISNSKDSLITLSSLVDLDDNSLSNTRNVPKFEQERTYAFTDSNFRNNTEHVLFDKKEKALCLVQDCVSIEGETLLTSELGFLLIKSEKQNAIYLRGRHFISLRSKKTLINLDYLTYIICSTPLAFELKNIASNGHFGPLISKEEFLSFQVPIPSKSQQEIQLRIIQEEHRNKLNKIIEADKARETMTNVVSDIRHSLKAVFSKQADLREDIYAALDNGEFSPKHAELIKGLVSTSGFIERFLKSTGANFSSESFVKEEHKLCHILRNYIDEWQMAKHKPFSVELLVNNLINVEVNIDIVKFSIMMDAIFENAWTHGFEGKKKNGNCILIELKYAKYMGDYYALMSICNNGKPFEEGFSQEMYIERGRYSQTSGHSGLGGNHVWSIVKGHNGHMRITQDEKWPVIFDILLPILDNKNIDKYIDYEYTCL